MGEELERHLGGAGPQLCARAREADHLVCDKPRADRCGDRERPDRIDLSRERNQGE